MEIEINNKKLILATDDIFAMAGKFDAIFLNTHGGFNGFHIQFEEFLKVIPPRPILFGIDKEIRMMSDIIPAATQALDEMNERGAVNLAMNAFWTCGEDSDNYKAQGELIKACIAWLKSKSNATIQSITLVDINPKKNFETAYNDFVKCK